MKYLVFFLQNKFLIIWHRNHLTLSIYCTQSLMDQVRICNTYYLRYKIKRKWNDRESELNVTFLNFALTWHYIIRCSMVTKKGAILREPKTWLKIFQRRRKWISDTRNATLFGTITRKSPSKPSISIHPWSKYI